MLLDQTGRPHLTHSLILRTPFKGEISGAQSGSLQAVVQDFSQTSSQCSLSLLNRIRSN